ncbi:MAG TPA: family 16 glycoside hydrolase, partial [Chitinophagaceae bacterium]|nr:family 16 glycoside hydrolase [Chitinophagaceae bacterium]
MKKILLASFVSFMFLHVIAQGDPKLTEVWSPEPKVITPGKTFADAPSDALILFNGKNLDQWVSTNDTTKAAGWKVADGIMTVDKTKGNIQTKKRFMDYQLHLEY